MPATSKSGVFLICNLHRLRLDAGMTHVGDLTPRRVAAFDILNILACISVVALHVNGDVWTFNRSAHWLSCMVVQVVCYWAVPVFVMLTGATLMDYRERYDTRTFFLKRFEKTVIPFFAWSFIAIAYRMARGTFPWASVVGPRSLWNYIISAGPQPIYWFFPMIWGGVPLHSCPFACRA